MTVVGDVIRRIEAVQRQAESDVGKIPPQWSDQARGERLAEIDQAQREQVVALNEQGLAEVAKGDTAEWVADYKRRLQVGPQGAEQWAEAAARLGFVRLELAGMGAQGVVRAYRLRQAAGDDLAAWLIALEGPRRLGALASSDDEGEQFGSAKAANELQEAAWGELDAEHKKQLAVLSEERIDLARAVSAATPRSRRPLVNW